VNKDREELRRLVDELPENELKAARRYLEFNRDAGKDSVRLCAGKRFAWLMMNQKRRRERTRCSVGWRFQGYTNDVIM